jgi:Flp pilus assembly pilin Flp
MSRLSGVQVIEYVVISTVMSLIIASGLTKVGGKVFAVFSSIAAILS